MNKKQEPFQFPKHILNSLGECSKDGCFLLIYKDETGSFVPIVSTFSQADSIGIIGFAGNFSQAINNCEISQMIDGIQDQMEGLHNDPDDEEDEEKNK